MWRVGRGLARACRRGPCPHSLPTARAVWRRAIHAGTRDWIGCARCGVTAECDVESRGGVMGCDGSSIPVLARRRPSPGIDWTGSGSMVARVASGRRASPSPRPLQHDWRYSGLFGSSPFLHPFLHVSRQPPSGDDREGWQRAARSVRTTPSPRTRPTSGKSLQPGRPAPSRAVWLILLPRHPQLRLNPLA